MIEHPYLASNDIGSCWVEPWQISYILIPLCSIPSWQFWCGIELALQHDFMSRSIFPSSLRITVFPWYRYHHSTSVSNWNAVHFVISISEQKWWWSTQSRISLAKSVCHSCLVSWHMFLTQVVYSNFFDDTSSVFGVDDRYDRRGTENFIFWVEYIDQSSDTILQAHSKLKMYFNTRGLS